MTFILGRLCQVWGDFAHRLELRLVEDFQQYRTSTKIPLALRATADTLLRDVVDEVFQLFSHDVIRRCGFWSCQHSDLTIRQRRRSIELNRRLMDENSQILVQSAVVRLLNRLRDVPDQRLLL